MKNSITLFAFAAISFLLAIRAYAEPRYCAGVAIDVQQRQLFRVFGPCDPSHPGGSGQAWERAWEYCRKNVDPAKGLCIPAQMDEYGRGVPAQSQCEGDYWAVSCTESANRLFCSMICTYHGHDLEGVSNSVCEKEFRQKCKLADDEWIN